MTRPYRERITDMDDRQLGILNAEFMTIVRAAAKAQAVLEVSKGLEYWMPAPGILPRMKDFWRY